MASPSGPMGNFGANINANINVSARVISSNANAPAAGKTYHPWAGTLKQAPLRLGAVGYNGRCEGRGLLERQTGFEPASSG